jgi:hypothetical protein
MRSTVLLACMLATTYAPRGLAADAPAKTPPKQPAAAQPSDEELEWLEFLGSIDAESDDSDWLDFLRVTDIGKVAKHKPVANRPEGKIK